MTGGPLLAVAAGPAVALGVVVVVVAAALTGAAVARAERSRARERLQAAAQRLGVAVGPTASPDEVLAALERRAREVDGDLRSTREARTLLQEALDGLTQAVMVVDRTGTVVERNAAAEPLVEARHSDALVEAAVAELVDAALRGESASRTIELFGPPRRVVVVTTAPLAVGSGPAAVAVVDDITERRRLEAVRTDFVANISHELKTPIGAIGLLAETLEVERDPEVAARLAARIQAESLRVGRTIEDLLELSRIELGQVAPLEQVRVADIVHEAVERIRPAAEHAAISLHAEDVPADLAVAGDRRQLLSALSNLLDNAVKYSDAGGSVEVAAAADGDRVVLGVTDHGIGIPSRDVERVFERFYRVDQARSRQTGGTGLGLAIVRHVVVNHHGSIDVESRLGEGSRFVLRLPSATVDAAGRRATQPTDAPGPPTDAPSPPPAAPERLDA
jgi:two-component system sensor histidine kinase SenX3